MGAQIGITIARKPIIPPIKAANEIFNHCGFRKPGEETFWVPTYKNTSFCLWDCNHKVDNKNKN